MNYWIFQGNPKIYKIDTFVKENKTIYWSIRQKHFKDEFKIGDVVFIWRSDGLKPGSGGIVAKGRVIEEPTHQVFDDNDELMVVKFDRAEWYLNIEIEEFRLTAAEQMLKRTHLMKDPKINNLRIFKFHNETNYLLTRDEGEYIEFLWAKNSLSKRINKWEYLEFYISNNFSLSPCNKVNFEWLKSLFKPGSIIKENQGRLEITYQDGEYYDKVKFAILDYLGSEEWEICGILGEKKSPSYYLFKRSIK